MYPFVTCIVTLCNISDLILHGCQHYLHFRRLFRVRISCLRTRHSIRVVFTHCILLLLHVHACTLCIGITLTRLALKGGGRLHETFRPSLKPRIRESWLDQMQNKHSPESTRFPSPINRENRVFNRVLNIRANLRGLERLII